MASIVRPTEEQIHQLTREEGRELFERKAQRYLNMSGEDFLAAWDRGDFDEDADRFEVVQVVMLLPLVR